MAAPPPTDFPVSDRAAYLAQVHIGVTAPILALCVLTFSTRLYLRARPVWNIGIDDYFIIVGFVSRVILHWPVIHHR
jgi:hypothetical protein